MRYVIATVSLFVAAGLTVGGAIEAKKLVGVWEMGPPEKGGKVTFTKDGKLHIVHKGKDGAEEKMDGTYKVKDDKITVTFEKDGKTETKMGTIEKLTAEVLVIVGDGETKKMEFKRVK